MGFFQFHAESGMVFPGQLFGFTQDQVSPGSQSAEQLVKYSRPALLLKIDQNISAQYQAKIAENTFRRYIDSGIHNIII